MKCLLTPREEEVLKLIIYEHTSDEIADKLCLSRETIKSHRKNLFKKFKARNCAGLVRRAFEHSLSQYPYIYSKSIFTLIIGCFLILSTTSFSQHLDVNGHSKIRGNLDINHMDDTTSVFIGRNSGINIIFPSARYSTFLGSRTGVNTTGTDNSFFGTYAGRNNISGGYNSFFGSQAGFSNTEGYDNSFFGAGAGSSNLTGFENAFFGENAGLQNIKGSKNTLLGANAGYYNLGNNNTYLGCNSGRFISDTTAMNNTFVGENAGASLIGQPVYGSNNSFIGQDAGTDNTTGEKNVFLGQMTGHRNISGSKNTFIGQRSGEFNSSADRNTFSGYFSGASTSTGGKNTFLGAYAGRKNKVGTKNTCLGDSASLANNDMINAMALGYRALVNADNKVRIGNDSITVIEGQVPFSPSSDIRLKEEIQAVELGLDFINELNPVSYHRKANPQDDLEMGLIAQQLKSLLVKHGMKTSGMVHQVGDGYMSVRYNDLFAPLIKAVQELSTENQALRDDLRQIKTLLKP